jgi:pimeloyl-ACP methyl ester carboxylesterase
MQIPAERRQTFQGWQAAALIGACAAAWPFNGQGHANAWPEGHPKQAGSIRRGSLLLEACGDAGAYCGHLDRRLDPTHVLPDRISIYFEFYPHSGATVSRGTLVATEGGPGYPATESRDDYLALFKPLMIDHDVVIMDNRGTGKSGAIDCPALQTGEKWTVDTVAQCGESLGERAALYGTEYAADDLASVLETLNVGKIDLYGDSYGTYFEQVFAVRHPDALRSIVLDGAYPLRGPDYAWYPSYAPAMRDKFNLTCARSPDCAAIPGSSIDHIRPALDELRAHPFTATAHDVDGNERQFRADASQLAIVMYGSAPRFTTATETDAAARAFAQGDRMPMLRLMAETAAAVDSRDPTANPLKWSAGLAAAVMCHDPPQIFDMTLAPPARAQDRDRAVFARQRDFPDTYAPFSIDEYRGMPLDYSFLDQCVGWPVAPARHPASQVGVKGDYPDVPALIISGELDNITTMADGAAVAASFKRGVQIRIANSFHVNALPRARSPCAAQIVRRFIVTGLTGDTSCAARIPPLRLVPRFAVLTHELEPASRLTGNAATEDQLRSVTAALLTLSDVLARVDANSSGKGMGLRGGSFRITSTGTHVHLALDRVRWVDDLMVSGSVDWLVRPATLLGALRLSTPPGLPGTSHLPGTSRLPGTSHLPGTPQSFTATAAGGRLTVSWRAGADARAHIVGRLGNAKVAAEYPAPWMTR